MTRQRRRNENSQKKLRKIMAEAFGISSETFGDAPKVDYTRGWDSLAHMNLIEALELQFDITISHEESVLLLSEQEIIDCLMAKGVKILADSA